MGRERYTYCVNQLSSLLTQGAKGHPKNRSKITVLYIVQLKKITTNTTHTYTHTYSKFDIISEIMLCARNVTYRMASS